jgi:hypothetical protein
MMTKLVIESVPAQAVNFVKAFCQLIGDDEQEFWRRVVAGTIDHLADNIAPEFRASVGICRTWDLEEAMKSLNNPRGPVLRKMDEEVERLHERERKKKQ